MVSTPCAQRVKTPCSRAGIHELDGRTPQNKILSIRQELYEMA